MAPTAVSSANAIGCMQTLPEYHQNPNYKSRLSGSISLTNPDQNTERGAEYLCYLASLKPGDWTYVVHAYNAGEAGALSASLPAETRAYCSGVKAYLSVLSPPLENQLQCKASTLKRECIDETNINFDQSVALLTKLTAQFLQCWSCDLLEALTVGGILTGEKVYDKLRSALIALILAVQGLFALWYVFKVMQPFGADGRVSGVFNEYASNLFVAFFICLVLASSGFFWKYLYIPVLSGAMDLSGTIVSAANNPQLNSCAPVAGGDLPNVAKSLGARLSCQVRGVSEGVGSGVTIGWAMWNRMTLIAEGTQVDLSAWANAGRAFIVAAATALGTFIAGIFTSGFGTYLGGAAAGTAAAALLGGDVAKQVASLLDRINLFFSGGALMAVFFYASLIYVFGVMEVILRWTVIALASPLMIASYAFKQTRGMAFWGLKGMFESLMSLAMMSVVALIAIALVTESMEKQAQRDAVITATSTTATTPQQPATATPAPQATTAAKVSPQIASIESLVTKIETDKDYKGVPTMNTLAFWELITVGLLIGGLMQRMPAIARQLIGGAGASMPNTVQWGQTVGNRAASFAGSSARAVGSVSASVVGSGLRRLTGR
ncbi:MAG: lytic transglycosylase domain-containing protein [Thalassospira sp.]|nr:lytic transglycosylase domain-containing protein [Thalassospira sp.]